MASRKIDKELQMRVLKYLDFISKKEEEGNEEGEKILHILSKGLKEEINQYLYKLKKKFKILFIYF